MYWNFYLPSVYRSWFPIYISNINSEFSPEARIVYKLNSEKSIALTVLFTFRKIVYLFSWILVKSTKLSLLNNMVGDKCFDIETFLSLHCRTSPLSKRHCIRSVWRRMQVFRNTSRCYWRVACPWGNYQKSRRRQIVPQTSGFSFLLKSDKLRGTYESLAQLYITLFV